MPDNLLQVGAIFNGEALLAGMREATAVVEESCAAMKESFVGLTESVEGVTAGFSGMFSMLGIGIFGHMLNELKQATLETSHLAEATGLTVIQITELKDAMNAAGVSSERLPMQLTRLAQSMTKAADGSKVQKDAF